ncbi:MAG: RNA methyltransferase [Firmicutes bacterium]|nr:RNA methyltransferase [Bacillota bacterium]
MDNISSKDNRILKQAASLKEKKYRDSLGMYLVEGPNFLRDAFLYGGRLRFIFTRAGALSAELEEIIRLAENSGSAVYSLTDECFAKLSDSVNSQGIIGVAEKKLWQEDELFAEEDSNVLVLDRVQDPGNLGTMLRTAEAMGFSGALLLKGCCDVYSPKAARACAGSLFRLPVLFAETEDEALELLKRHGKTVYAALMDGELSCMEAELAKNAAIVIGNEGNGVSEGFAKAATGLRIPMAGSIESLNAAMASGMLMYEAYRQKLS